MRLIDADELKKCAIPCEIKNGALTDLCVPVYQIDYAPTVKVGYLTNCANCERVEKIRAKRPTGEWEYVQYDANPNIGNWHCSKCRHIVLGCIQKPSFNFCPNCGSYMKGGTNAEDDLHHPGP